MSRVTRSLLIGFVVLCGCKQSSSQSATRGEENPVSSESVSKASDRLQLVDSYMAAWNEHNLEKAAAYFAPNVVYFDASVGTPAVGAAAGRDVIQSFLTLAPDVHWARDPKKIPVVQGDAVVYQWTFSGTNTGPMSPTQPATNKKFTFSGVTIMRFQNEKIVEQSDYYDALGFLSQLGWAKTLP